MKFIEKERYAGDLLWRRVYSLENELCISEYGHVDKDTNLVPAISHGCHPMTKSLVTKTKQMFAAAIQRTKTHSFRHETDVICYLWRLAQIYSGEFESTQRSVGFFHASKFEPDIKKFMNFDVACINDDFEETFEDDFVPKVTQKFSDLRERFLEFHRRGGLPPGKPAHPAARLIARARALLRARVE